jgi:tetratricopeptide (TPR) repeat protein
MNSLNLIYRNGFLFLTMLFVLSPSSSAHNALPKRLLNGQSRQLSRPLTLDQIQALIRNSTPDAAIAKEIRQRGISFGLNSQLLADLIRLGAGPKTIESLRDLQDLGPQKKVTILVAEFISDDAPTRPLTVTLIERLRSSTKDYTDITIGALNEAVTVHRGGDYARQKGAERGADIVIWGWYSGTDENLRVNVHFEVIRGPRNLVLMQDAKTFNVPVSEFKSFDIQIQTPLSGEMSYLSLLTLGLARAQVLDFDGAIAAFTRALSLPSTLNTMANPADLYFYRGAAHVAKSFLLFEEETDLAIADLTKAIELRPESAGAYMLLGTIFQQKRDSEKALHNFEKMISLAPDDPEAFFKRAAVYITQGRKDLADKDLARALDLLGQETDTGSEYLRAQIHVQMKNFPLAESVVNRALAIETDPDARSLFLLIRVMIYLHTENYKDAVPATTAMISGSQFLMIPALTLRAAAYSELNKLNAALADANELVRLCPSSAQVFYLRGDIKKDMGDLKESIEDYSKAIELDPHMGDAYVGRGEAYLALKNYPQAIAEFDKAIGYPESQKLAYANRGAAHSINGQLDQAILDYSEYIKLATFEEEGYSLRATAYLMKGDDDKALADLTKALELDSKDADLYVRRGKFYEKKSIWDKALEDYSHAIGSKPDSESYSTRGLAYMNHKDYADAIRDFDKAITLDPKNSSVWLFRGLAYANKGDLERAVVNFTEYIRQSPSNSFGYARRASTYKEMGKLKPALRDYNKAIALKSDEVALYFERGEIYEQQKDLQHAASDYTKIIKISPSAASYRKRGLFYFDNQNWNEAISDFSDAIKIDPADVDLLLSLALVHEAKGDFVTSLKIFDQSIALKPDYYKVYLLRANAYTRHVDWPHALENYDKAADLAPINPEIFFKRASVYRKNGNQQRAIADYTRAIELNSDDARYFSGRASAQLIQKQYALAVADLDKAIALNDKDAMYLYFRGVANNNQKHYDLAIADLNSALKLKPNWDSAFLARGVAYSGQGDRPHAARDLRECLRVTTDDQTRRQAQAALERLHEGKYLPSIIETK